MKRWLAYPGTAVAVAAAISCTAASATAPAAATSPAATSPTATATTAERPRAGVEELRYVDVRTDTAFLDLGRRGGAPSPGDAYSFRSTLRNVFTEDAITRPSLGELVSTCTVLFGTHAKCAGSLLLSDGTVEIAGTPDLSAPGPIVAVVIGGTGRYASARGVATFTPTADRDESRLVVRLDRR